MSPIETLMRQWLDSGTDSQKRHAEARIRLGFDKPSTSEQPSLATKAMNLGRAVVSHARAGSPTVDDAIYQARLDTCHACPNLVLPAWVCGGPKGCGCNLKLKARWAEQKCPLAKWER